MKKGMNYIWWVAAAILLLLLIIIAFALIGKFKFLSDVVIDVYEF